MPKDQTRNIEHYRIGADRLNEFEFHHRQQEFAEQGKTGQENFIPGAAPQTRAEQVQAITERAEQIARRRSKKPGVKKSTTKKQGS